MTVRRRELVASATARQPLPVPTSTIAALRVAAASRRERFFDDELGFRPRNEDVGRDLELEAPELAVADDVGDRLARGAARDERRRYAASKPSGGGRCAASEQLRAIPAEHVPREHLRVERGFVRRDAGADERARAASARSAQRSGRASLLLELFRLEVVTAWSISSSRSPSSASVSWCIVKPMR